MKTKIAVAALAVTIGVAGLSEWAVRSFGAAAPAVDTEAEIKTQMERSAGRGKIRAPLQALDDSFLRWPLDKDNQAYGAIDGKKLKRYVNELAAISKRYRDSGHPYWGRITGTAADVETQQFVVTALKKAGITNFRTEKHALPKQFMPKAWSISITAGGETFTPTTAFPVLMSVAAPAAGLDLEAVYVGTGSVADFIGRDVKGKIAVLYSNEQPAMWNHTGQSEGGVIRAARAGAAAIVIYLNLPVNATTALYPLGMDIPVMSVGSDDGYKMRELLGKGNARIKMKLDIDHPDLETATIFGTLPGTTDETIYVTMHRDAFFEGGQDNASGIATALGLADYFGAMPKEKRRRNIVFVSMTGHHNNCTGGPTTCTASGMWVKAHAQELFAKTALIINAEHTAMAQTYVYHGPQVRKANTQNEALLWYVNGSPKLEKLTMDATRIFGVPTYAEPEQTPAGEMGMFYTEAPSLQLLDVGMFGHTDKETAEIVPWTGLEGAARAYAKIIDGVNTMSIQEIKGQIATTRGQ